MTYILVIWTMVANPGQHYDWRPIGEFHTGLNSEPAKQMCENAARELNIKPQNFRCVRSR